MKAFSVLFPTLFFVNTLLKENTILVAPHSFRDTMIPARFTDSGPLSNIEKVFPLLDKLFEMYAKKNHLPGVAYGIVADGRLVHTGNYGFTDIQQKIPVSPTSIFRIASMSKSFTAMAILQLRDAGKLNLDDPAYRYIPALKKLKYPTADAPLITIRHLLTHSAGFPEDNPWGDRQLEDTDEDLANLIEQQLSFSNPPGVAYEYSNLGFAMLGRIITVVSGEPYQQYIRKNILLPLGMQHTGWEFADVAPAKLAHGYRWINDDWKEETLLHDKAGGPWGAMGGMLCSVQEFASYMALHIGAWPPSDAKDNGPLKRSSVREMHHPWRFNGLNTQFTYPDGRLCPLATAYGYGLGWTSDCEGRIYIAHSGGLPGFGSQWRILPDYGIGVVALANRTYAPMGSINLQVLDTLVKVAHLKPRKIAVSAILEQRKKELLAILPQWKDAEKSGSFAENFFPDYPIDSLRKESIELFIRAGKIHSVKEMNAENQLRGSFILEGENNNLEVYFTLSPENPPLIQEFHIREIKR